MKVLYLEDNAADAHLTVKGLRAASDGFEVEIVHTVAEALAKLDQCESDRARNLPVRFDLALLDMHLPDGSGLGVLSRIRDRALPLAAVVLTGGGDEAAAVSAIRAGADDYVPKRFEYWTRLPEALDQALRNFRSRESLDARPIRLLYVEPNRSDVEFLRLHFAKEAPFIRLEVVDSPAGALARLPVRGPVPDVDVVLLDFRLTGIDALELLKEINQVRRLDLPVLISTGQGTEEIAIQALKLGAMDYIEKAPGYLQRLPFAVESAFYRNQAIRERAALRESEARLRTVFETEPECVCLMDAEGAILEINPAGLAMLEAESIAEARRCKVLELIHPEYLGPFQALHEKVLAGASGTLEFEMSGLKGSRRRLETHVAPMRDAAGKIATVLGITRDVSEQRRNEERLRQHEKLSAIGQLAGGIAHDFNNQLAAILGYAELLATRIHDKECTGFIDTIVQATKRSGKLTRSLLDFSRQGQLEKILVDVHHLIRETMKLLVLADGKLVTVTLRLEADSALVVGDPSQIQNALLNLALNARDAMPGGGILEFATEGVFLDTTTSLPKGRYLHITVRDSGTGMSPEVKRRIFEPFFTTKPVGLGTGMGLASVYGTVASHHGAITVESEVGRGTAFHIHLPLSDQSAELEPVPISAPGDRKLRVLVVDDEPALRAMISDMLRSDGHDVLTAGGGREALSIYAGRQAEIDLVLMDMVMPDMGGGEALREIRALNPAAKVVLTSGFMPESDRMSALSRGAADLLGKPFTKSQLDAAIARAISAPSDAGES